MPTIKETLRIHLSPLNYVNIPLHAVRSSSYFYEQLKIYLRRLETKPNYAVPREYIIRGETVSPKYPLYKKELVYQNMVKYSGVSCEYCKKQLPELRLITFDHFKPQWVGGRNNSGHNLLISCYQCNQFKGGMNPLKQKELFKIFEEQVTNRDYSLHNFLNKGVERLPQEEFLELFLARYHLIDRPHLIYFMKMIFLKFKQSHLRHLYRNDKSFYHLVRSVKKELQSELCYRRQLALTKRKAGVKEEQTA